ncbi:DUF5954 family protein [Streptomyces sp. NPDC092296]|uniref:DUF5954 family protein n=1 Tax=Streptomyces sp. NPDC092296 TaxID=3366012 RepID=UPI0038292322
MDHNGEQTAAHRVIRVTAQDSPVADLVDLEAWEARSGYPELRARGPLFAVGRRRADGLWEIVLMEEGNPQAARDALMWRLREISREAQDPVVRDAHAAAVTRLEWETLNELSVAGTDYRIIRGDLVARFGPDGPEPPRPTDPDPIPSAQSPRPRPRAEGFVIDAGAGTGMSEAILRAELTRFAYSRDAVPPKVYADSCRVRRTHPNVVILPATYAVAEQYPDGHWETIMGSCATPQEARDTLAVYLRDLLPATRGVAKADRSAYARAADRLKASRGCEAQVDGRRFRLVRLDGIVRVGPDGPEKPRDSDWVPYPPSAVHDQQLRAEEAAEKAAEQAAEQGAGGDAADLAG